MRRAYRVEIRGPWPTDLEDRVSDLHSQAIMDGKRERRVLEGHRLLDSTGGSWEKVTAEAPRRFD